MLQYDSLNCDKTELDDLSLLPHSTSNDV
jgi:hypothetical protein